MGAGVVGRRRRDIIIRDINRRCELSIARFEYELRTEVVALLFPLQAFINGPIGFIIGFVIIGLNMLLGAAC